VRNSFKQTLDNVFLKFTPHPSYWDPGAAQFPDESTAIIDDLFLLNNTLIVFVEQGQGRLEHSKK
jgi:hypothetical protein